MTDEIVEAYQKMLKERAQCDVYKRLVENGKPTCSHCANALYASTIAENEHTKARYCSYQFRACLLSSSIDCAVYECSQFAASKNPHESAIKTDENNKIIEG